MQPKLTVVISCVHQQAAVLLAFFAGILGFALIWSIYWFAGLGLVGRRSGPLIESCKG